MSIDRNTGFCSETLYAMHTATQYTHTHTHIHIYIYIYCAITVISLTISLLMLININIYIYIKWTVFVNVTRKSAQHAHARMIAIIVEKSPNSSHMYDHGFMDNTNRQAVKN